MNKSHSAPQRTLLSPLHSLSDLFDFCAETNRRAAIALVLVSLCAFLPGFFQIPPVDRDEPRYAQATKQMIETGDYVDIRFQDEEANDKPIGIYWLQAAAVKTAETLGLRGARDAIWVYRLPSLFAAIGAVLATYWCALAFVGRRAALLAALMMAGSILLGVEARLAKTDAVLLLCVVVTMGALARVYLSTRDGKAALPRFALAATFWTAFAAGVLVKGLPIIMIALLTAATLSIVDRSARWLLALRPLFGIAWSALLVLPWFIAISTHIGGNFLTRSVGHDTLGKILQGQQGHGAPPGYYFVLFFITFFPAAIISGLAAPAVVRSALRREPAVCFLLAWLVPAWIVFEVSVTKLPHYVLPLYPAIAILIALTIERNLLSRQRFLVLGLIWWFLIPLIAGIAVIVAAITLGGEPIVAAWPFLAAAIVCGLLAWRRYEPERVERSLICASAASVLIAIGIYGFIIPTFGKLFPSATIARIVRDSTCAHPVAASAGYQEPSIVFLAGTATELTNGAGVADFLHAGGCRVGFLDTREEGSFAARAEAIGLRYTRGERFEGVNLGHVEPLTIDVFRPQGTP